MDERREISRENGEQNDFRVRCTERHRGSIGVCRVLPIWDRSLSRGFPSAMNTLNQFKGCDLEVKYHGTASLGARFQNRATSAAPRSPSISVHLIVPTLPTSFIFTIPFPTRRLSFSSPRYMAAPSLIPGRIWTTSTITNEGGYAVVYFGKHALLGEVALKKLKDRTDVLKQASLPARLESSLNDTHYLIGFFERMSS